MELLIDDFCTYFAGGKRIVMHLVCACMRARVCVWINKRNERVASSVIFLLGM